jgi:S-adenosylmethionine hydrolase
MNIITFLTDFGMNGNYVAQMKGAALSLTDATLIDITHDVTPHNVREGAFILQTTAPYFPVGTVHVAVVDPGVGTDRRNIFITARSQILVGPDNGLLLPAAHSLGDFTVYEITNGKYMPDSVSNTFHGRDIFSPVAARIIKGISFEDIGNRIDDFVDLDFGEGKVTDNTVIGKIIYIDRFGNLITNIAETLLLKHLDYNKKIKISIGKKRLELPFVKSYGFVKKGELLATVGSSNSFEISMNQGNAAKKLSIKEDDKVEILFT